MFLTDCTWWSSQTLNCHSIFVQLRANGPNPNFYVGVFFVLFCEEPLIANIPTHLRKCQRSFAVKLSKMLELLQTKEAKKEGRAVEGEEQWYLQPWGQQVAPKRYNTRMVDIYDFWLNFPWVWLYGGLQRLTLWTKCLCRFVQWNMAPLSLRHSENHTGKLVTLVEASGLVTPDSIIQHYQLHTLTFWVLTALPPYWNPY